MTGATQQDFVEIAPQRLKGFDEPVRCFEPLVRAAPRARGRSSDRTSMGQQLYGVMAGVGAAKVRGCRRAPFSHGHWVAPPPIVSAEQRTRRPLHWRPRRPRRQAPLAA